MLNPAEPPLIMRDTVYTLSELADEDAIARSVEDMAAAVQAYVPGYRMKQKVQFDRIDMPAPARRGRGAHRAEDLDLPGSRGRGPLPPAYAGNLDIMTSAGLRTAEHMARRMLAAAALV